MLHGGVGRHFARNGQAQLSVILQRSSQRDDVHGNPSQD
jgi:hypothetical protein